MSVFISMGGHFFRNSHNSVLMHVMHDMSFFCLAKEEKEPFEFNSSCYGHFSRALSYFLELFLRLVYRLT